MVRSESFTKAAGGRLFKATASAVTPAEVDVVVRVYDEHGHEAGRLAGRLARPDLRTVGRSVSRLLSKMAAADGQVVGRIEELRKTYPHAYQPWTAEDEERLSALFVAGRSVQELASTFGRQPGSIVSRLQRLGHVVPDSPPAVGHGVAGRIRPVS